MVIKLQGIKAINWTNYNNYCYRNGLAHGDFKNLKKFVEGVRKCS